MLESSPVGRDEKNTDAVFHNKERDEKLPRKMCVNIKSVVLILLMTIMTIAIIATAKADCIIHFKNDTHSGWTSYYSNMDITIYTKVGGYYGSGEVLKSPTESINPNIDETVDISGIPCSTTGEDWLLIRVDIENWSTFCSPVYDIPDYSGSYVLPVIYLSYDQFFYGGKDWQNVCPAWMR